MLRATVSFVYTDWKQSNSPTVIGSNTSIRSSCNSPDRYCETRLLFVYLTNCVVYLSDALKGVGRLQSFTFFYYASNISHDPWKIKNVNFSAPDITELISLERNII